MRNGAPSAGVRWREDVGFELRCDGCVLAGRGELYWPITLEFWNPDRIEHGKREGRGMRMCRACYRERDARWRRGWYRRQGNAEKERARNALYRAEGGRRRPGPAAALTDAEYDYVRRRRAEGVHPMALANEFGVSVRTIYRVLELVA